MAKPRTFDVERMNNHRDPRLPWALRCYGHGGGYVCNGQRSWFSSEITAREVGETWVRDGITPAHQRRPS